MDPIRSIDDPDLGFHPRSSFFLLPTENDCWFPDVSGRIYKPIEFIFGMAMDSRPRKKPIDFCELP